MKNILAVHIKNSNCMLRLIILVFLLFLVLYDAYSFILISKSMSFSALLVSIFNAASYTQFSLLYLLLFFAGDIDSEYKNKRFAINKNIYKSKSPTFYLMSRNFIGVCIYVAVLIIVLVVIYLLKKSNVSVVALERNNVTVPIADAIHSVFLNVFYYTFILLLALIINLSTKQWFGTIIIFFFCWLQYDLRLMLSTIGRTFILPIEHSLIYYDSIFLYEKRAPLSDSYIYWIIVFSLIYIILNVIINKESKSRNKGVL